jgi:molecular chaperone GrpE
MSTKEQVDKENQNQDRQSDETTDQSADQEVVDQEVVDQEVSQESIETSKLEYEVADLKEKYLRLYSDFENYRKRTAKERLDLITSASEDVLKDLIPVVDDFERALKAKGSSENQGDQLIYTKLVRILISKGLKPMDDLVGKAFDTETQEAITQIPSPSEDLKGKVVDVIEKGYTLGDKVVRHAKVITGA